MPKSIQLYKQSTIPVSGISSMKLVVEARNNQEMTDKIFVYQRVKNFALGDFEDTFVAVCTPTQLEDFGENSPSDGSSYYRSNRVELVGRTPEMLQTVFDSLVFEVKKLVVDLTDMDNLTQAEIYNITATGPVTTAASEPTVNNISTEATALSLFFSRPIDDGGSAVLNYQHSINDGAVWITRTPASNASPLRITGLTPETAYTVIIRAITSFGYGRQSSPQSATTLAL
jgi:hypothetical protein